MPPKKRADKAPVDRDIPIDARRCVTIFGGGIAGLTVAHELVERRFHCRCGSLRSMRGGRDAGCAVGGMARTQWCGAPWPADAMFKNIPPDWPDRESEPLEQLPHVFYLRQDKTEPLAFGAKGQAEPAAVIRDLAEWLRSRSKLDFLYSEIQFRRKDTTSFSATEQADQGDVVAFKSVLTTFKQYVEDHLPRGVKISPPKTDPDYVWMGRTTLTLTAKKPIGNREIRVAIALLDGFPEGVPSDYSMRIGFRIRQHWLPGEHGFRVFPVFYSHVFDTMKRTPIFDIDAKSAIGAAQERSVTVNARDDKYVETGRTNFDNLRPTSKVVLGLREPGPFVGSLFAPNCLEDIRKWLGAFLGRANPMPGSIDNPQGFGVSSRDMARCRILILRYLTSCDQRRKEYEHMTWFEYLGGGGAFSKAFNDMISAWPEALDRHGCHDRRRAVARVRTRTVPPRQREAVRVPRRHAHRSDERGVARPVASIPGGTRGRVHPR